MLTREDKIKAYAMLLDGYSHTAIGQEFGVTKEAIRQIFGNIRAHKHGPSHKTRESIVYPALRNWLVLNELSVHDFARKLNLSPEVLMRRLRGKEEFKQGAIEAILKETGLTYEEAFRRGGTDDNCI